MDVSKKIEVKQSALSSLKSELFRKKQACLLLKTETANVPRKKLKLWNKTQLDNETVSVSPLRTDDKDNEDEELLRKSRKCLENKARLYDEKIKSAGRSTDEADSESLVNFPQKNAEEQRQKTKVSLDANSVSDAAGSYGDESDWVEYVDFLGRTRKCLKEDLDKMKKIDDEFLRMTSKESSQDNNSSEVLSTDQISERPEFLQRLHEEWEEQERRLKEKQNIHYQDVFFNEARAHGVGYYTFSTDEEARAAQQAALERLRQETKALQRDAKQNAVRALAQNTERVDAAKKRMLQLLQAAVGAGNLNRTGAESEVVSSILTPVQAAMEATQKDVLARRIEQVENMTKEEKTEPPAPDLTELSEQPEANNLKTKTHIRPWDEGKEGIASEQYIGYVRPQEREVMSQDKWIEKKREERLQEFAPFQEPDKPGVNVVEASLLTAPKSTLFFSSRKEVSAKAFPPRTKLINKFQSDYSSDTVEVDYSSHTVEVSSDATVCVSPTSETGTDALPQSDPYAGMSPTEISEAVEAGLKYLRHKAEEKEMKPRRGFMDIL